MELDLISGADLCWASGGIICNFTPILPYFQHWGGWTSTTILFRCGKLVETKRKMQTEHFFSPNKSEDQKKKVFFKNRTLFLPDFRWRPKKVFGKNRTLFSLNLRSAVQCTPIQIIGGDAEVDHSQTIGGDTAKLLGGYISPIPPGFGTTRFDRSDW